MILKIALVGCGKIADGHIEEVQKLPNLAKIVGVCDREILMAEQIAQRHGIDAIFDNISEMIQKTHPDVIHITTPPQSHSLLAKEALQNGCHVYIEKPISLDFASTQELINLANAHNKKLITGYTFLYDPATEAAYQQFQAGTLGEILHIESMLGYNLSGPFGAAVINDKKHWVHSLPGKLIHNSLDHLLYRGLPFYPDRSTPTVTAHALALSTASAQGEGAPLFDELRVLTKSGTVTTSITFSSNIRPITNWMKLYGTKDTILIDYLARTVVSETTPTLPSFLGRLASPFIHAKKYHTAGMSNVHAFRKSEYQYFAGMKNLIERFYRSILDQTPGPIADQDMLYVSALMDQIFEQVNPRQVRTINS